MDILRSMSDAAHDNIKDSYDDVLEQLAEALTNWDEQEVAARSATDKESRPATNPYKKLMGQLYGWMQSPSVTKHFTCSCPGSLDATLTLSGT